MSNTAKNLIIILGLITVAFAGYFIFTQSSATTLSFTATSDVLSNMRANSQLYIERRRQLETVTLNQDFFSDQRFTSLQSFNEAPDNLPVGRTNPFAEVRSSSFNTN